MPRRWTLTRLGLSAIAKAIQPGGGYETTITQHLSSDRQTENRRRGYPSVFFNDEGFVFPGCSGRYEEYPVLQGKVFGIDRPAPPGPHRIIFEGFSNSKGVLRFCGCVTHTNAPTRKGFLQCT
ncbi:hypothetical protein BD310DRAFT_941111 [Dichomitus squalens]|uniref:Uncharacterized protein n=1 Tax=Dichomitus squalens TaxID=114155 RepID=A0A4Q9PBG7_9APHY|nr:hypothetical protein BD310DRAFT_941111 [Dichomitus squalens]